MLRVIDNGGLIVHVKASEWHRLRFLIGDIFSDDLYSIPIPPP